MKDQLAMLAQFNHFFRVSYESTPTAIIPDDIQQLRYDLLIEEVNEYIAASQSGDVIATAKELCDILYVTFGAILAHGLQDYIEAAFAEVHKSNLSKLDGNGQPIFRDDGKVLKSDYYFPPDIASIVSPVRGD